VLLLNVCLFLLFISLSTQYGNFWIHSRTFVNMSPHKFHASSDNVLSVIVIISNILNTFVQNEIQIWPELITS
jgi:hypothetical protein